MNDDGPPLGDWARGDVAKVRHLDGQIVKGTITDIDYSTDYAFLVLEGETITRAWPISKLMPDDSDAMSEGPASVRLDVPMRRPSTQQTTVLPPPHLSNERWYDTQPDQNDIELHQRHSMGHVAHAGPQETRFSRRPPQYEKAPDFDEERSRPPTSPRLARPTSTHSAHGDVSDAANLLRRMRQKETAGATAVVGRPSMSSALPAPLSRRNSLPDIASVRRRARKSMFATMQRSLRRRVSKPGPVLEDELARQHRKAREREGYRSVAEYEDPAAIDSDRVRDNALARLENLESNKNQMGALRERVTEYHEERSHLQKEMHYLTYWDRLQLSFYFWRKRTMRNVLGAIAVSRFWQGSLKLIGSHSGTAVLGYFEFFRFVFALNFILALFTAFLCVLPMEMFGDSSYNATVPLDNSLEVRLLGGAGRWTDSFLYYGYYVKDPVADDSYNLPLAYFFVIPVGLLVTILLLVSRVVKDKERDESFTHFDVDETPYGIAALASWPHAVSDEPAALRSQRNIAIQFREMLSQHVRSLNALHTGTLWGIIPAPRSTSRNGVIITLLSCAYLVAVGYACFALRNFQYYIGERNVEVDFVYGMAPAFIVTLAVHAAPLVLKLFVAGMHFRSPLARQHTSLALSAVAVGALAGTYVVTFLSLHPPSEIPCWETRTGQAFYRLFVLDSIFKLGGDLLLLAVVGLFRLCNKHIEPNFDISSSVLATTYRQSIVWMSFFLVPMLAPLSVGVYFLEFYVRRALVLYASKPPRRMYRLTATVYKRYLLCAFLLAGAGACFMAFTRPTGTCGPFQGYKRMYSVLEESIRRGPRGLEDAWTALFSRGVAAPFLIALILICASLRQKLKGTRSRIHDLRHHLEREQQDFRALLHMQRIIT